MGVWILLPIFLSLVSLIGTWAVYALAFSYNHVCSLTNWHSMNSCSVNESMGLQSRGLQGCCRVPTISSSGANAPENSLFTATINAGSFLFVVFCIFHHAHILDKSSVNSMLSRIALIFGIVASFGAFMAGNCNPGYLMLLHYLGAAVSFTCICFYSVILTELTRKCTLTGLEMFLYPPRILSTVVQLIATIIYTIMFSMDRYMYSHVSAVFEWVLSVNLELFELSFAVEFYFFSSSMLVALLGRRDEEKPLILN